MTKNMKRILLLLALFAVLTPSMQARTFRIMTFNIRLATSSDGINAWDYRKADVVQYLNAMKPDVFGMQEVKSGQLKYLADTLKAYAYAGVGRDDGKDGGEYGPVFYRKDRYQLMGSGTFWLSETPEEPSFGWNAACRRICTWTLLQDKKSGNSFIFANTHLDHVSEQARTNGAELIKKRLSRLANNLPVLITGDFNCTDQSQAYQNMITRIFPMNDAYKVAKKASGMHASYHAWGTIPDDKGEKIDFIFITPGIKVKRAHVWNSLIGEGRYLSDHHPHYADLDAKTL